jgi:hypothetical protein
VTKTTDHGYDWRHNWVPITMRAALMKAHGNHEAAERMLAEHHARKAARGHHVFVTPLHEAAEAHRAGRTLRELSDDELADAMGDTDDDEHVGVLLAELDRRDKAAKKAAIDRARRERRRAHRDAEREADYDRRVAAGDDPEQAYAEAYGLTAERVRRDEAIRTMRDNGYRGKGFTELARAVFVEHQEASYWAAEEATNGYLVNAAGERAGIHGRSLFTGNEDRARKYASPELLDYWQEHGRMTLQDFTAGMLGGHMSQRGGNWA